MQQFYFETVSQNMCFTYVNCPMKFIKSFLTIDYHNKNFRYVEKTSAECNEDSYLAILHLARVELHCKLQEKLHRVTWP